MFGSLDDCPCLDYMSQLRKLLHQIGQDDTIDPYTRAHAATLSHGVLHGETNVMVATHLANDYLKSKAAGN